MDIKQLCDRYGIASKKTLYRRLAGIGLELNKENGKVSATEEQIELLDQLDEHISKGGAASNFVPLSRPEVVSPSRHTETQIESMSEVRHTTTQLEFPSEIINLIAKTIGATDPLLPQKRLELLVEKQWEVSTSQLQEIIGSKPQLKKGQACYQRGSFLFYKIGKIGNESSWIVKRKNGRIEEAIKAINQQE